MDDEVGLLTFWNVIYMESINSMKLPLRLHESKRKQIGFLFFFQLRGEKQGADEYFRGSPLKITIGETLRL